MSERNLISSSIQSAEAFRSVADHVVVDELTAEGRIIWGAVEEFYDRDPAAESINLELLVNAVKRKVTNPKHEEMFADLVVGLAETPVSPPNVVADFIAMKREVCGEKLAVALSKGDAALIDKLLEEYQDWQSTTDLGSSNADAEILNDVHIDEMIEASESVGKRIKMYPKALNDHLGGGLLRGHHVVLFARPEMGKTMFLVNSMYGFAKQNLKVLYIGNEDPIMDVMWRCKTRFSGMPKHDAMHSKDEAERKAAENGFGLIHFCKMSPGTLRQIEGVVRKEEPDVLIVDQLRNIQIKDDNFTQQLEKAARGIRTIGQRYNALVVSVTQAGNSADHKPILEMTDVDSSNTGIPAQADVMIGMGGSEEDVALNRRTLSLPKNKPGNWHGFFQVGVNPVVSSLSSK